MSYYFSEKYGESQKAYLDINNFTNTRRTHKTASRLVATLQRAVTTTDYVYINYYRTTYGNIPLWVLVNVLTFGNLSKMYQVFPQSLQSEICKNFAIINRRQMEQFLSVLTKFRNVCAHGERLFTYQTMDNISDLPLHRKLAIPMNGIQYQYGKKDLFAVVIAFRYLIPASDFRAFKRKLTRLIDNAAKSLTHLEHSELLERMGFPPNWKDISRYRLTP
jgi:abortive infection bacteriophage resistance protein